MARLSNSLILLSSFLFLAIPLISAFEEESVRECAKHIGPHCGDEVKDKLFYHNMSTISTDCCYKIYQSGYPCHTKLTIFILKTYPEFKNANWMKVLAESDKIFNQCDEVTKPSGSPKFLLKCVEKMGTSCGDEVVNKLFHDKNISKKCCEKLVKTGRHCHISMVKALIRTPEMRNVNAIQTLEKSKELFEQCQHA